MSQIKSYRELRVYQSSFASAMEVFEISKRFPAEERYNLTDQIRRSSRSVCANMTEGWRRRRFPAHFVSKLNDSETEAEETRVWLQFAAHSRYMPHEEADRLDEIYDGILGQIVRMANEPEKWCFPSR